MTILAGLEVKPSEDMTRIQAVCEHQRGLIYVVPRRAQLGLLRRIYAGPRAGRLFPRTGGPQAPRR